MKLWAIKMLFVWRWRLGAWHWDAFWSAFTARCPYPGCLRDDHGHIKSELDPL